jgi:hypothetical protein
LGKESAGFIAFGRKAADNPDYQRGIPKERRALRKVDQFPVHAVEQTFWHKI